MTELGVRQFAEEEDDALELAYSAKVSVEDEESPEHVAALAQVSIAMSLVDLSNKMAELIAVVKGERS